MTARQLANLRCLPCGVFIAGETYTPVCSYWFACSIAVGAARRCWRAKPRTFQRIPTNRRLSEPLVLDKIFELAQVATMWSIQSRSPGQRRRRDQADMYWCVPASRMLRAIGEAILSSRDVEPSQRRAALVSSRRMRIAHCEKIRRQRGRTICGNHCRRAPGLPVVLWTISALLLSRAAIMKLRSVYAGYCCGPANTGIRINRAHMRRWKRRHLLRRVQRSFTSSGRVRRPTQQPARPPDEYLSYV